MSPVEIIQGDSVTAAAWSRMRHDLWPHLTVDAHADEIADLLLEPDRFIAFIAREAGGEAVAFAEASLRQDYVNGCETTPVAFLEGIFVKPGHRRRGVAARLVEGVCAWARTGGVSELASDADIANSGSIAMHGALGFSETQRVVYFRRLL